MRNILLSLFVTIISFSFLITDAQAKRFGGGKSFGMSRQASSFSRPTNNTFAQAAPAAVAKPASTASRWLGPLAGLAAGGLLASLFMGHGLGSGILSWLLVAGGIFMVWSLIRSRFQRPATQPMQNTMYQAQSEAAPQRTTSVNTPFFSSSVTPLHAEDRTSQFDEAAFLRNAKAMFIRLQAAYDHKNLADMREFTMPEVFAEIQLQLQERGNEVNQTDVLNVDADLLDVTSESHFMVASVQFSGQVREQPHAAPEAIKEIWHLRKDNDKSTWLLAGIQQV